MSKNKLHPWMQAQELRQGSRTRVVHCAVVSVSVRLDEFAATKGKVVVVVAVVVGAESKSTSLYAK